MLQVTRVVIVETVNVPSIIFADKNKFIPNK
jgi:hypothetical protein